MTGTYFYKKGTKHSGTNHTSADPGIVSEHRAVLDGSQCQEHIFVKRGQNIQGRIIPLLAPASSLSTEQSSMVPNDRNIFSEKWDKTFRDESYLG
jgi:hypothetical protein